MSAALILALDWDAAAHLAAALDRHIALMEHGPRRIPVPEAIHDLAARLAVGSHQERPSARAAVPTRALWTYNEAAQRLSCSVSTIRRLVKRGELRAVRVGARSRRIAPGALEEYVERRLNEESA